MAGDDDGRRNGDRVRRTCLALSVFASIELRVALVRAVNSGVSALIDPNGRVLEKTYANDPYRQPRPADGMVVSAPGMSGGHTVYVAVGNLFAYLCLAATLLALGFAWRGNLRRRVDLRADR